MSEAPHPNVIRIATAVAADIHAGRDWQEAIDRAADILGVERAAVVAAVKVTADYLRDPYLESIGTED